METAQSSKAAEPAAASRLPIPVPVTDADRAFGGKAMEILPPYNEIPRDFPLRATWERWQSDWFYSGLKCYPVPRDGIDLRLAMANLACVQGSFSPKHEHKALGVAYLASLWFTSPEGAAA